MVQPAGYAFRQTYTNHSFRRKHNASGKVTKRHREHSRPVMALCILSFAQQDVPEQVDRLGSIQVTHALLVMEATAGT
jgi:hypothetical protein